MGNMTKTTNGMAALKTSHNACVDLFGKIGSARGVDISVPFNKAFKEDANIAIRILLWARDVRGGAGERQTFRTLLKGLVHRLSINEVSRVLAKIPELGRWDDLFEFIGINDKVDFVITDMVVTGLTNRDRLLAKWMPREGKKHFKFFLKGFDITAREYRKTIVGLSDTVEQKMCAKQWDQIDFGKIPSIAAKNYSRAFKRNAPDEYQEYIDGLTAGTEKINASAIFPYDVIKSLNTNPHAVVEAQWKSLPDYMEGSDARLLGIVDVSASMTWFKVTPKLDGLDIAVSLGLYVAERGEGIFKDQFITFSSSPALVDLRGTVGLQNRVNKIKNSNVGGSTDLEKTFNLILTSAVKHKVPADQMPTKLIIWSDMQFNQATGHRVDNTAFEMIDSMYRAAGYKRPQVVFWNLNAEGNNVPVSFGTGGTAMVSGFSPAIMKGILKGEDDMTPQTMMLDTVNVERYDW